MDDQSNLNNQIDNIYTEIGEIGFYQVLMFLLIGITSFIPSISGYGYVFIAATPNHRQINKRKL